MSSVIEQFRELRDLFFESLAENRRFIAEDAAVLQTEHSIESSKPASQVSKSVGEALSSSVDGLGEYERATLRFNVERSNLVRTGAMKVSSKSKSKVRKYELSAFQQNLSGINKRNAFFNLKLKRHWEEMTRSQQQ